MTSNRFHPSLTFLLIVSMILPIIPYCTAKPTHQESKQGQETSQFDAKELVSRQLLTLMGLKDIPQLPAHRKIPQYMMDLYKIKTQASLNTNKSPGQFSNTDLIHSSSKLRGNTIRSYFDLGKTEKDIKIFFGMT
ncbi:hypothetical protein TrispH2_006204 [Trichoplax sp. H2]|nr:hypothetical protein TrispH2_006204 [Trichoplax sp. H2]|eukprot:RDD41676.1 hypothetical protein TrispH2_006204 [Trichoplax sp. H2]